jgi:hypothetical protein
MPRALMMRLFFMDALQKKDDEKQEEQGENW